MSSWISCKIKIPKFDERVLLLSENFPTYPVIASLQINRETETLRWENDDGSYNDFNIADKWCFIPAPTIFV